MIKISELITDLKPLLFVTSECLRERTLEHRAKFAECSHQLVREYFLRRRDLLTCGIIKDKEKQDATGRHALRNLGLYTELIDRTGLRLSIPDMNSIFRVRLENIPEKAIRECKTSEMECSIQKFLDAVAHFEEVMVNYDHSYCHFDKGAS